MKFSFKEVEPEASIESVSSPQLLVCNMADGSLKVLIYFMCNAAQEVLEGRVNSGMGKTILLCKLQSPSGVVTASVKLRKLEYVFPNPQGMITNFVFKAA